MIDLPRPILDMIDEAIEIEVGGADNGGYTDDPADPGGKTKWGVTEKVWRDAGYSGYIHEAPRDLAVEIFIDKYVTRPGFMHIARRSYEICNELVEAGINLGPHRPSVWLQEILNVLNVRGRLYSDIATDGIVGPGTENALRQYCQTRDPDVITLQLNHLQGAEYQRLAESDEKFERFMYGWIKQRTRVVDIPGRLRD